MTINFTFFITTSALVSHIFLGLLLLGMVFDSKIRAWIYSFVEKNVLYLLFTVSLAATIGSLTFSDILGLPPCELCWFQRIFIYPQALLAFLAILKKDKGIIYYLLPFSIMGAIVAFYQSLLQWGIGPSSGSGCVSLEGECARIYVLEYGYITIPLMALTAFVYLIVISLIYRKSAKIFS